MFGNYHLSTLILTDIFVVFFKDFDWLSCFFEITNAVLFLCCHLFYSMVQFSVKYTHLLCMLMRLQQHHLSHLQGMVMQYCFISFWLILMNLDGCGWMSANRSFLWDRMHSVTADLAHVTKYCQLWRLKPSISKTLTSVFHLHNNRSLHELNVHMNGQRLKHDPYPVYLGVNLDRTLIQGTPVT